MELKSAPRNVLILAHMSILIKTICYVLSFFSYTPYNKVTRMCGHFLPPQVNFTRWEGVSFSYLTATLIRMCHTSSSSCSASTSGLAHAILCMHRLPLALTCIATEITNLCGSSHHCLGSRRYLAWHLDLMTHGVREDYDMLLCPHLNFGFRKYNQKC